MGWEKNGKVWFLVFSAAMQSRWGHTPGAPRIDRNAQQILSLNSFGEKKKKVPAKLKDIQEGNSEHIICSQTL